MQEPLDLYVLRPLIAADLHADKIRLGLDEVACLHCWSLIFGSDHHFVGAVTERSGGTASPPLRAG